jgi:uncharacterized protein (TIGR03083 family)
MAILDLIADERRTTADLVDSLDEAQLRTRSLCSEWTVHDVGAHLLMPTDTPLRKLVVAMVTSAGNFDKVNLKMTAQTAKKPSKEVAAMLRANAQHPFKPPGHTHTAPLTDLLIHGQDMRRPLGIRYRPDDEKLRIALDFLVSPTARRGFVDKRTLEGLRFEASDLDWSSGDGPTVRGPATSLLMLMAARPAALDDVAGDGVATLRQRIT